ncbi:3-(cis-5,6-dihydroxycyclohexa-1,3-dien-1-yl)propanoate dehydrogenase [Actinomadura formosensis]|uniref:3-(cis-5,6-dihydroxycyclohexa-1, 3-dien-1-yl)propanoate dehydrogenase n=1 Tax=Actinomadura formosensis TaxID=60706 RepID=UPI003D8BF338
MGWLEDTSVVVTGAGSGLGLAIVERFAAEGASVVAIDKSAAKLAELQARAGERIATITGDVRDYADNERACELAVQRYGKLDAFIGNAGIWDFNESLAGTPASSLATGFDELFAVNVKAYLLGAKAAQPPLAASRGSMIFTLSNAALYPAGGGPLYVASKHAGLGLVRQLAYELAPDIRVNGVAPGGMATDLRGPEALGMDRTSISDAVPIDEMLRRHSALHRAPRPADYVGAYVLLAARQESATVTGTVIDVSGFGTPARPADPAGTR